MIRRLKRVQHYICENALPIRGYFKSIKNEKLKNKKEEEYPIDFVVTWVDGNDPSWQAEKKCYEHSSKEEGNIKARFRDWGLFVYWFRMVEKYAPWVNRIYLVTYGHVPKWLNAQCPKVKVIKHEDYMPAQFLPTFNSISIELNLWRIPELSEHFVYFNDDVYLTRPVTPNDFFENGLPKYSAIAQPLENYGIYAFFQHQLFSNLGIINKKFNIRECIEKNPDKWFAACYGKDKQYNVIAYKDAYLSGMHFTHLAYPYRKSTFEKVWKEIPERMEWSCEHKFREPLDLMHQIFQIWEICEGTFCPVPRMYYGIANVGINENSLEAIISEKNIFVCLNDNECIPDDKFEILQKRCIRVLENSFPEKSSFEK